MKFKCINCDKEFVSSEKHPECPMCSSHDVERITEFPWKKVLLIGAIVAIVILIIAIFANAGKDEFVNIVSNKGQNSVVVTISGPHYEEYKATLRRERDGKTIIGSRKKDKEKKQIITTYKELASIETSEKYTLKIEYIGKSEFAEKGKANNKTYKYSFAKLAAPPTTPQIVKVNISPRKLTKKVKTYTCTIDVDTVCKDKVEYSIDNSTWQTSNVFKGLQPNTYTFYVRNTKDHNLSDSKSMTLAPYSSAPLPTKDRINELLRKIAQTKDDKSFDYLREVIGSASIIGASNISDGNGLINDAYIRGTIYNVESISVKDGVIEEVTIK